MIMFCQLGGETRYGETRVVVIGVEGCHRKRDVMSQRIIDIMSQVAYVISRLCHKLWTICLKKERYVTKKTY